MNSNIDEQNIIEIKNLTKNFGQVRALNNVSLDLPKGKIVGLLGPNGSGKTTLMKVIVDLLMDYQGQCLINGLNPGILTKEIVSYLPDRDYLNSNWTFIDAVNYFNDFYKDFDKDKAYKLLNDLHIPSNVRFKALSKGTREKMQLILVLSRKALVYVFDEPIAGVDPVARDLVFKLITENHAEGSTVIISTHLIMDIESYLDYVVFIKNGEIVLRKDKLELVKATNRSVNEIFKEVFKYEY